MIESKHVLSVQHNLLW